MLAQELAESCPGIEKTQGVAGGEACIVRTRIPAWTLENYRQLGWSEARILDNFPSLPAGDLVNAWAYVNVHQREIKQAAEGNEEA